jgi:hypothetical protein
MPALRVGFQSRGGSAMLIGLVRPNRKSGRAAVLAGWASFMFAVATTSQAGFKDFGLCRSESVRRNRHRRRRDQSGVAERADRKDRVTSQRH